MEATFWSVIGALAVAAIIFILKYVIKISKHEGRIKKIEENQPLLLEGMFTLLQVAKNKGDINGDSDDLFKRYKAHLFNE